MSLRKGRNDGRHSKGWEVWNTTHPEDLILPGTGYIIHHKDHDHFNNSPNNLQKMTNSEHTSHHRKGIPKSDEHRSNISKALLGRKRGPMPEEWKRKIAIGNLGKIVSVETKKKMSGKTPWNKGLKYAKTR